MASRKIEWAIWANEQAFGSGAILVCGGVIQVAGRFQKYYYGIYGIVLGLLVMMIEYPRGKRQHGKTVERPCQWPFAMLMNCCGCCGSSYCFRFCMYLILCTPCSRVLALILGGVCLLVSGILYMAAAANGEGWEPLVYEEANTNSRQKSIRPPKKAPPRAQKNQDVHFDIYENTITIT